MNKLRVRNRNRIRGGFTSKHPSADRPRDCCESPTDCGARGPVWQSAGISRTLRRLSRSGRSRYRPVHICHASITPLRDRHDAISAGKQ